MRWKEIIKIFNDFIKATIEFDDKLYKQTMNKRYSNQYQQQFKNYVKTSFYNKSIKLSRRDKYTKFVTTLMKLNAIMFKKFKSNEKKSFDKKKKNTTCYACGKKGHYARNCRSKNVIRRQFNITLKKQFKAKIKKNWKNIDYENIEILIICFKNEKFFKIDESQDFQNVLNGTKNTNLFTTKNVNRAISQ